MPEHISLESLKLLECCRIARFDCPLYCFYIWVISFGNFDYYYYLIRLRERQPSMLSATPWESLEVL